MEARISGHKRTNSDPLRRKVENDKLSTIYEASHCLELEMGKQKDRDEAKKRQCQKAEVQDSLKQEISELQERLHDQYVVRSALEKALSYRPLSYDITDDKSIPKAAQELIKEVALLELEVVYLEQYLLSLYRKTFDQGISSVLTTNGRHKSNCEGMYAEVPGCDIMSEKENSVFQSRILMTPRNSVGNPPKESSDVLRQQELLDSGIHRSHSSLSHRSAYSARMSPSSKAVARALDSYHSLPLSMLEQAQTDSSNRESLAMHLGISDHVPDTPNWLSEEMIKCISSIYCELADPPLIDRDYLFSPVSYSSSTDMFSSREQADIRSQQWGNFSSFNAHLDNPFHIGESKEFSGPYSRMAEVQWIQREKQDSRDTQYKLGHYRSLVYRLEEVNPRKMKHEEKLAFWINVHNALVMHAFLVYGIPKNNLKRITLILKAAYNVGGQSISVDMIQNSILGCRVPRPGQWLQKLFPSKTKFKVGDARKAYAIEHPEPLLHFALSLGCCSDPAVRIYTPKRVHQEVEAAKEEYIQSNFSINKDQKVHLPKIVETFVKDSGLCILGLADMIDHFMPESLRKNIQQAQLRKLAKSIEWIPHNFAFRYLLSKELT